MNAAPTLSPLSDPESRFGPEKATEGARRVLRHAVAESRAEVGAGGNSFVVPPLYDETPAVSDRGSCEPRLPHRLVGEREWLGKRGARPMDSLTPPLRANTFSARTSYEISSLTRVEW